jgi:NAD(P)-dependent dehydrogenase (short-subunit alcohol dehydrogenase family)
MMPKPISDQVVVITGASSGIGLATARAAASQGAKVVLAARNERDLDHAVEEIRRAGGDAVAVPTDVAVYEQVEALADRAVAAYGRIDSWVNNAAVSAYAPVKELPLADVRRIMDVNFMGQVHGAMAALPHLERTDGALICIGSALSDRGVPLQGAYCASKHALKGWLDSLRVELMADGSRVRVTLVKPSSINTPLFNKAKTQLGVMPQPIPPIYEPELAAEAILRAAEGNERDLFVGGSGKALSAAERLSPRLVDLQQRVQGFESQKTEWPKSADAPHNLYEPLEHDGGVQGDFLERSHPRSAYQALEAHAGVAALVGAGVLALGALMWERSHPRDGVGTMLRAGALALTGKALVGRLAKAAR